MSEERVSEKRIFSYEEASALLPEVRRLTEEAHRKVEGLGEPPEGGRARDEVQAKLDEIVTQWARTILDKGLEVKGLWLVDFDNGSGYYCWHYPEEGVQYYHSYEDGFGGRMRIQ
jgi:hypothetical protein